MSVAVLCRVTMPPKKNKKNAVTFFIETTIIPEKQREGYNFRNGFAALIPEASQRFKVSNKCNCT